MSVIHGTCVIVEGAGVLIRGPSGAGKSDLALRLIDGGARLVADDACDMDTHAGEITLRAPAAIHGRIEARGLGIVHMDAAPAARLHLIVDLAPGREIERLPDKTREAIAGILVPWIQLDPFQAAADAKVRMAARALIAPNESFSIDPLSITRGHDTP
jgi:HPr kinase/phosphorylase